MPLPPLREELVVQPGPRTHDGQPSWTLEDPARNRFFRLDWLTFEILQRWSLGEPEAITAQIAVQTPLHATEEDVASVVTFLSQSQLLRIGPGLAGKLAALQQQGRPTWWRWLVHNYLFFRVPLVRPERILRALHAGAGFLFRPGFWWLTGAAAALGLVLLTRQAQAAAAYREAFISLQGLLGIAAVLIGVKVVHELGHGLVATHYGCRVPTMGVAFLVMTPVAYTDTNDAWTLTQRRARLLIGGAGMLAELALAAWATLAWAVLPDGGLRAAVFVVAAVTWVKSLLVNVSPFMRFDGYYLLSDFLDLPNLHARAFALTRWQLREWLFRLGEAPPEYFRPGLRRGLVALAIFIWVYRLVVFVGIAVFVYHFFFKALGIVLFAVEIAWFVLLPLCSEFAVWRRKADRIRRGRRVWWLGASLLAALGLFAVPLPQRVHLSGEFQPMAVYRIVAPESGRLRVLDVSEGGRVVPGQRILQLESPTLRYRQARDEVRLAAAQARLESAAANPAARARLPVLQAELETARAALAESKTALGHLEPAAPFGGTVRLTEAELAAGDHVTQQELLATVVGDGPWRVVAYAPEDSAHLLQPGARAVFYPDGVQGAAVELQVRSIEPDASRVLAHPMLAAVFGGGLPGRLVEGEVVPERAVYRVECVAGREAPELQTMVRRGHVVVHGASEPLGARFLRAFLSVMWRELGF